MDSHTPAPWAVFPHRADRSGPLFVKSLRAQAGVAWEIDNPHDAALISAAPDLASAILPLIEMAEAQGRFWRAHQKRAVELEEKTRFAVRAEPWEDRARIGREALAMTSPTHPNRSGA